MELILVISLIMNGAQFYWSGNLKAENRQLEAISKNCKLEEQDERKREFGAAEATELARSDISRIIARSEQHIRATNQGGGGPCDSELDRRALHILEEASRRASEIDQYRLRGSGPPND